MPVDSLVPNDPRVEHKFAQVGDNTYHYMLAQPQGKPVATIFLCHGWPDLGMGWRYQVPFLVSLNLRVVVPDMLGYGRSSAPEAASEYRMKKMADDMAAVVREVNGDEPIILGGHDWGGFFVWRMANYHPGLIRAIFSLCVPYMPPAQAKVTLQQHVDRNPNFLYQLQNADGRLERMVGSSRPRLEGFLRGMSGGRTPEGGALFSTAEGVAEDRLERIGPAPLADEAMIAYYADEYARHGPLPLHGPCNWYRTMELNADDEVPAAAARFAGWKVPMPAMVVMAGQDAALPPSLADGQEAFFAAGLKKELVPDASHWVQTQKPEEVNRHIGDFIKGVLGDDLKSAL